VKAFRRKSPRTPCGLPNSPTIMRLPTICRDALG
jgi:hypothetical protein